MHRQERDNAVEFLKTLPESITSTVHNYMLEEVRKYFFIGGMPESVKSFVKSSKYQESFDIQNELIETFRENFAKYAPYRKAYSNEIQ